MILNAKKIRYVLAFAFFAFVFLFSPLKGVFANGTDVEVFPPLEADGEITDCDAYYPPTTFKGFRIYTGVYPDTSTRLVNASANSFYSGVYCAGVTLENGLVASPTGWPPAPDGTYWFEMTDSGSAYTPNWTTGTSYWFQATRSGGVWTGGVSRESQIIDVTFPTESMTVVMPFTVQGHFVNTGEEGYDNIRIQFHNGWDIQTVQLPTAYTTTYADFTTLPIVLEPGTYEMVVRLYNSETEEYSDSTVTVNFDTGSTPPAIIDPATECSITEIGTCLMSLLQWAFLPSEWVLNMFADLSFEDRAPFVYLYQLKDMVADIWSTGVEPAELTLHIWGGEVTMFSQDMIDDIPFVGWVRTVLGYLLYLMTAFTLYRIVKNHTV